jgi:hypothetical protein
MAGLRCKALLSHMSAALGLILLSLPLAAETAPETHTNRLIDSGSPYLLQHAHNPVDWYPWGDGAIGRHEDPGMDRAEARGRSR